MTVFDAPGLPADWLNGWLAAVGVTVLVPGVRLSWSEDAIPTASFHPPDGFGLAESVAAALPTKRFLDSSTIARKLKGTSCDFGRNVSLKAFQERAAIERKTHSDHLAGSISDLTSGHGFEEGNLPHGAFDPPAPRGETLWSRAVTCAVLLEKEPDLVERVRRSLAGAGTREQINGLGFDCRRLPAGTHAEGATSRVYADPVVELLCLGALRLFPVRGNGRTIRQRGWHGPATRAGGFEWVAWRPALDRWAIDAFIDLCHLRAATGQVIARYHVVPYQPGGTNDTTRAYFSSRVQ